MKTLLLIASLLVSICAAVAQTNVIFPRQGTVWKYNQTNDLFTDAPLTWMTYDYDDSGPSWQEGPALLSNDTGNGTINPLIQTIIPGPRDIPPVQHARFFRKKFTYAGPVAPFTQLRMDHRFDDGVIIWLNGVEIGRKFFNSATAPTFLLRSDCFSCQTGPCTGGGDSDCEEVSLFPGDQLLIGDNIIAFSLHQTGNDSSDITFGTSLEVILPRTPTILSNSEPADRIVLQNRTTTLRVFAEASPAPTYQWYYSVSGAPGSFTALTDQTNSSYTIASMQLADQGYYYCTVANPLASVDSRTAYVQYTEDNQKPLLLNAIGSGQFDRIIVQFNEALDANSVLDPFNWGVTDNLGNPVDLDGTAGILLSSDGSVVTLVLAAGTFLAENADYTVSAASIIDLTGLNTMDDTNFTFRTFVAGCSTFLFETYGPLSTTDNNINNTLKVHPSFPEDPREPALRMPSFDTRHVYPTPDNDPAQLVRREGFGARIRGLFVPTVSTTWRFYVASDDSSEVYLNPNGPDSSGKQLIARETGCCNNFQNPGAIQTSVPISLQAGQPYYIEAIYKEGTGGDWLKLAARPSSEAVPPGGNADNGQIVPVVIQGSAGPAGILSHVVIGTQPADRSAIAGQVVSFSVRLNPDVPACFQWKRNGVDIPDAFGPNHKFTASLADDGAKFSVAISLMGGSSLLSSEATLTVGLDTNPPTVTSVTPAPSGGTNISVVYSEPVDPTTGTATGNYSIPGLTIQSATLANPTTVNLIIDPALAACQTYTLSVSGVRDANTVLIVPTNITFIAPLSLLVINASQTWRYDDNGFELGDAWYASGYDDSAWSNGPPTLAFPAAEVIQAGYPVRTVLIGVRGTTYFRTHFNLQTDPSSILNLQLQTILDDGGIFYLNGQELTRIRMPGGIVDSNTLSTASSPSDPPQIVETYSVPVGALQFGDNVLAARVHQSSATSSDTVFAAGLLAQVTSCVGERPRLQIVRDGNNVTISVRSGPTGTIYRSSSLGGPWSVVGAAPQTVPIGPGSAFFELRP